MKNFIRLRGGTGRTRARDMVVIFLLGLGLLHVSEGAVDARKTRKYFPAFIRVTKAVKDYVEENVDGFGQIPAKSLGSDTMSNVVVGEELVNIEQKNGGYVVYMPTNSEALLLAFYVKLRNEEYLVTSVAVVDASQVKIPVEDVAMPQPPVEQDLQANP